MINKKKIVELLYFHTDSKKRNTLYLSNLTTPTVKTVGFLGQARINLPL